MIDPETLAPGDWLRTPDGFSVLLVRHRPNVFHENGEPGRVYGPGEKVVLAVKTFCRPDGKPVTDRKAEGCYAPILCDPVTDEDWEVIQQTQASEPAHWETFSGLKTSSLVQPCRLNIADGLDTSEQVFERRRIVERTLEFPAEGATLNSLSLSLAEAGLVFDYYSASRAVGRASRLILNLRNEGMAQTESGENLFVSARFEAD